MLIVILTCGLASTAFAGPIILGGDDLDYHGNYVSGVNQKGWLYIQRALASMYKGGCLTRPGNDGSIAVLGAPLSTSPTGGIAGAAIHFAAAAIPKVVTYYNGAAGINNFFALLSTGSVNPAIIYIPSGHSVNGIDSPEGTALTTHATELKNFVNSGGGVMAHISTTDTSGWVTAVTGVTVNINVCNSTGATLTSTALNPLLNSDIDGTAGPCHATFSGTLGGLSVLALDGGSPTTPARNYIIGGCATIVPPVTTLCCPPWNSTTLSNSMFYVGSGGFSLPYTLKFQPSPILNTQMEAYVAYIHALYPTVTTLTNTFNLQNGGTGNTCSASGPSTVGTAKWTWTNLLPLSPANFYAPSSMVVNNWYKVSTVTTLDGTHPPLDATCIDNWMCFRIQVVPSPKAMPGHGQSEPTLQMRLPDGRMIERALSTKMTPN
jgi:hypothetical protein